VTILILKRLAFARAYLFPVTTFVFTLLLGGAMNAQTTRDITNLVTEGYVDNNGVKIHYATLGQGPLVIFIHGHPDFWYGWRNQMLALAQQYQVVAIDQRGINLSSQPQGIENYTVQQEVADVAAVIGFFKQEKAILIGHDTGASIAWAFAIAVPQMTERLITLNLPHPFGLARERANNPAQQEASKLSLSLAQPNSAATVTREQMLGVVNPSSEVDKQRYSEAFAQTSLETFVAYFQANVTAKPASTEPPPKVQAPVLAIHGLKDPFILPAGYNDNWTFVANSYTLVILPNAGHFVQIDAADEVTKIMLEWLKD
jgi:epoxide hydrolase 4